MARGFSHSGRSGGGGGGFSFGGSTGRSSSGGGGFGGFSFGGSTSRSSSSDHHHHHHRRRGPWHIPMFGRTVVVTTGARSALSFVFVFLIMAMIICFSSISTIKNYGTAITESEGYIEQYIDYDKTYSNIIAKAKAGADGYYIGKGEFSKIKYTTYNANPTKTGLYETDVYLNGQNWWFIVYDMDYANNDPNAVGSAVWNDSTFTQYDQYALQDFKDTDSDGKLEIEIAYTYINGKVYAINTDYSLEVNKDYAYEVEYLDDLKSTRKSSLMVALGSGAVAVLIITIVVAVVVKKIKNSQRKEELEMEKAAAETAEANANAELAREKAKQINRTCKYCGASVPDGDEMCPACGSRYFEDK